jgi:hypothetical protein
MKIQNYNTNNNFIHRSVFICFIIYAQIYPFFRFRLLLSLHYYADKLCARQMKEKLKNYIIALSSYFVLIGRFCILTLDLLTCPSYCWGDIFHERNVYLSIKWRFKLVLEEGFYVHGPLKRERENDATSV